MRRSAGFSLIVFIIFIAVVSFGPAQLEAASLNIDFGPDADGGLFGPLQLLIFLSLITVAPSILIMMTSFTRLVIVFSFLRNAMALQQTPPNQVIVGLALFLTLFIMWPVGTQINETAVTPFLAGEISQGDFLANIQKPVKVFMLRQINPQELNLYLSIAGEESLTNEITQDALTELGMHIVAPAFITAELKRAFIIGFLLFIPFLAIDMVVASTLMSMGMVMLPPSMISLPFKLMLFVVVDGWNLIIETMIRSFH